MQQPLLSVIVPIYNVENYLDRCVESIVNQTYKNLEIILVDDGSPDNCPRMCDKWAEKDSRIKVVHKENGGLSDARNAGIPLTKGEIISFIDSDDWIEPAAYESLYNQAYRETVECVMFSYHRDFASHSEDCIRVFPFTTGEDYDITTPHGCL